MKKAPSLWGFFSFLQNQHLLPVLVQLSPAGDVDPAAQVGVSVYPGEALLPDELVKGAVALEPLEPFQAYLDAGKMQITGLSRKMLGMACAAHQLVKLTAAITAADNNRFSIVLSQGLQNLLAEVLEV